MLLNKVAIFTLCLTLVGCGGGPIIDDPEAGSSSSKSSLSSSSFSSSKSISSFSSSTAISSQSSMPVVIASSSRSSSVSSVVIAPSSSSLSRSSSSIAFNSSSLSKSSSNMVSSSSSLSRSSSSLVSSSSSLSRSSSSLVSSSSSLSRSSSSLVSSSSSSSRSSLSSSSSSRSSSSLASSSSPGSVAVGTSNFNTQCATCHATPHVNGVFGKGSSFEFDVNKFKFPAKTFPNETKYPETQQGLADYIRDRMPAGKILEPNPCGEQCGKDIAAYLWSIRGTPVQVGACAPSFPQDLILLSDLPFTNSVAALLGEQALTGSKLTDPASKLFTQKSLVANTSLINARLDIASNVANNLATRISSVTGCTNGDQACATRFITDLAKRGFKRQLSTAETSDLQAVFNLGAQTSYEKGIQLAVQAILISPSFNHRTEYGVETTAGRFALTPHEFASTLSFLLTDTLPDRELMAAADSGALANSAEREKQVQRLLALASTKSSLEYTLLSAWNFGNLFGKAKDPETYPQYTANLASQMYEETRLFLREHLWSGGLNNVLTSKTTFVNGALADLYGIRFPGMDRSKFEKVDLTGLPRSGLLTQASFLTAFSRTDETSVVARGLFVNGPLLCLPKIPPPPESVVADVEAQLTSNSTELERAEFRAATMPCSSCHNQFDAYGLMFENYNAIGGHRLTDERGMAIHSRVDFSKMTAFTGFIDGPIEFSQLVAGRSDFVECVTRHVLAYGTGIDGIQRNQCEVTDITKNLNQQSTLADVIKAVVASPSMSVRVPEASK
jgi:Protein of unknown function (DUF1592)/Protein of unknown function (DUF1588)/Protein of unknown function (DUF1595)/Protein of unknown function (DUF1585)